MTFPWKKVKSSGLIFSRLVADLHQPPRRGGTLVVETGFPTSLIDLIVKNRDRLRKSPKSKSTPQTQIQTTTPTTTTTTQLPCDNENIQSPQIDVAKLALVERECRGMFPFRAAFKIVVVVALAVSTRKLALWIMIAAFFLLVIEFIIGSSAFGFSRSKSHASFPDSLTGKSPSESIARKQEEASVVPDTSNSEENCIVEEIQIAESEVEEMETRIRRKDEQQQQQQHGESGRIRRRHLIKKLVPKKLRHGRRKKKKGGNDDDRCAWEAGEEIDKKEEEIEDESQEEGCEQVSWSGGGLMSVIVIVVAGVVVGGRGIALLVTLVWLLMLTYIKGRFSFRC